MITTLIILALSAVFFVNGKLRSDLVALCALVLLIVFNILTPCLLYTSDAADEL